MGESNDPQNSIVQQSMQSYDGSFVDYTFIEDGDHLLCKRGVTNAQGLREMAEEAQQAIVTWLNALPSG